jgi:DnaB-like helicase N terminal domain/AAA domain
MIESVSDDAGAGPDLKKSRRPRGDRKSASIDRLPPHSIESERGIIGCFLLLPKCVEDCDLKPESFYDLRHREIYNVLKRLWSKYKAFDLITVQAYMQKKGLLEQVGGIAYLSQLQDAVPSAANLSNYIGIVREKFELRKIITTCSDVVGKIYDYTGNLDELKFIVQSDLGEVFGDDGKHAADGENSTWNDLLEFETNDDKNNVIGIKDGRTTRYLCKGHSAWLIGPSGVGKSSLMLQFGVSFAAGKPLWGITPQKALRVLVIQAENDKGDMAEMARGIEQGMGLEMNEELQRNIRVRSVTGKIGQAFCAWLRKEIESFKADLVLVDPLLSFAGIDVSRQDQASQFCRVWLDPVLRDTGAVLISVHHTGKPPRRDGKESPQTLNDMAYAGIGSSELVNWARAVMLLQPCGENQFRLMLAKRGKRAGATHPSGEPTQVIWLKHATNGSIFWEQTEPVEPEEKERHGGKGGAPSVVEKIIAAGLGPVIDGLNEPAGLLELCRRISNHVGKLGIDASQPSCRRAVARLVESKAITKTDGKYVKN